MAKPGFDTANHIPKSLSIENSNHKEDLGLQFTWNKVVKSRISVKNSGSSRVTQNQSRITRIPLYDPLENTMRSGVFLTK